MHSERQEPIDQRSFRTCEQCGRLTPSQEPTCINCGAVSVQAIVAERQAREERRFLNALLSRATPVTYAILVINLVLFILMVVVAGGNLRETLLFMNDWDTLVAFGAKTNDLLQRGEWFRLVTPIFLHGGLIHLASNSYAIWNVGPLVEKLYGSSRFLLIYLLAGIGGVVGSYLGSLGKPGATPSVGASGAIFGLFGLLFVFAYRYRNELPQNFRRQISGGIVPVIVINLFIGYTIPVIDNSAHIGGLISGAVLSLLVPYLAPGRARRSIPGLAILGVCVLVIAASFVRAYQTGRSYLSGSSRSAASPKAVGYFLESFVNGENALRDVVNSAARSDNGRPASDSMARLEAAGTALEKATTPDDLTEQMRLKLLDLIRRLRQFVERPAAVDSANDLKLIADEFRQLNREFADWMEKNGDRYGYSLTKPSQ